ncbi:MAG: nucleoside hydrolase [Anaerolineales bacterium]|nr:nucleoside hydrolase [Anaerolineales bacterium]
MQKIILDCDNTLGLPFKEIDDGLALLYLLGRPDIEILGVTTVFGNGSMAQSYTQTRQLLRIYGRQDIPVYKGAEKAGEISSEAAHFLVETCAAHPGEISLVATGPITNLFSAVKLDPQFFANLQQVICMGGYLEPLRIGWRNVAELNFSADAQASWMMLNSPCALTVMSAQLCLQASFGWRDLRLTRFFDREMRRTIRNWLVAFGLFCGVDRFYLWDLLPVIFVSNPELFDKRDVNITSTVEDLMHGSLILGHESSDHKRINLPSKINDVKKFRNIMLNSWHHAIMQNKIHGG